ncbi:MAG: type VI secretion system lipoprotein TssJ [Luteimonas sp.]|nr:type VI secretion system lipoprotein TssJ [Luteimonas sp.]
MRRLLVGVAALALTTVLGGCASDGGIGKVVNRTLESVGIKDANEEPREQRVPLRLYAGENLNAGNGKRALAAVVKVYHLRGSNRFEQAPFDAFLDADSERAALGDDLVAVSEIVLTPGARHEIEERMEAQAEVLGIVALFRAPASNRWRLAFDARHKKIEKEGVTIGLHACAMTTSSESLVSRIAGDPSSLASVKCMSP